MIKTIIIEKFRKSKNKLLLLDYDGTLVDFELIPEKAIPSQRLLNVLNKLIDEPKSKVVIITGREQQDIDKLIGNLPLDIVAEHGAIFKLNGKWELKIRNDCFWKKEVFVLLNEFTSKCQGSFIEEKEFSLSWHYRNIEKNKGLIDSRELIHMLENIVNSYNLQIIDGNKTVEIMTGETNKGKAVQYLIDMNNYDYILCIGDDKTDEDMFSYLSSKGNCFTIKVGLGKTTAKYKIETVEQVLSLLEQL